MTRERAARRNRGVFADDEHMYRIRYRAGASKPIRTVTLHRCVPITVIVTSAIIVWCPARAAGTRRITGISRPPLNVRSAHVVYCDHEIIPSMVLIISSPRHTDATTSSANGGSMPYLHRKAPAIWRVNRWGVLISPFIHVVLVIILPNFVASILTYSVCV